MYRAVATTPRRRLDELVDLAKQFGAKGLVWLVVGEQDVRSPIRRFLRDGEVAELLKATEAVPGDLILAVADQPSVANEVLARLRDEFGARLGLADPNVFAFCWIVDFPLLEWEEDAGHWTFSHNPFCSPRPGEAQWLDTDPGRAISKPIRSRAERARDRWGEHPYPPAFAPRAYLRVDGL